MPKADEWRRKVDDWKAVLNQPKNAGLKAGGTGISEAIRKVADAEMDFAKGKDPAKGQIRAALSDLSTALTELIALCKKTSDKHKAVFTDASRHLDALAQAATARRTEAEHEVDELRKAIGAQCEAAEKRLKEAKTLQELATAWHSFVEDFEAHAKAFSTMKAALAAAKGHKAPDPNGNLSIERPVFLKLVQSCHAATQSR
jgi:hypothetical protein